MAKTSRRAGNKTKKRNVEKYKWRGGNLIKQFDNNNQLRDFLRKNTYVVVWPEANEDKPYVYANMIPVFEGESKNIVLNEDVVAIEDATYAVETLRFMASLRNDNKKRTPHKRRRSP